MMSGELTSIYVCMFPHNQSCKKKVKIKKIISTITIAAKIELLKAIKAPKGICLIWTDTLR